MARQKLILDRYRIIDKVGAGGFGTVQHAWDTRLERDVAIKCIALSRSDTALAHLDAVSMQIRNDEAQQNDSTLTAHPKESGDSYRDTQITDGDTYPAVNGAVRNPFNSVPGLEEARTAAQLNDPNIVTVYDCEVHNSVAYVIMEYVEGMTLEQVMNEMGDDISLDVIAAVFTSVAHALEVAHENDVLHLDIKPENVVVDRKGVVKVTDFGLATLMDTAGQATTGGGTISYMPPEQIHQEPLDVRTDEWALASLTYEMLSGRNPFVADNLKEAAELIENAELIVPSLCWDTLDTSVDDVIFKALDPDPDERYETIADFDNALTPLLGNARNGTKMLAGIVNDEEEEAEAVEPEPSVPREAKPPVVDRIGSRGASIIMRIIAAAGVALLVTFSLMNIRIDKLTDYYNATSEYGLASDYAIVFWVVLAVCIVIAVIRPKIGTVVAFALFAVMLLLNNLIVFGIIMLVGIGIWWWFSGRHDDGACTIALLQPLAGAIGMAAIAPVSAGMLLSVRRALATSVFVAFCAIMFAAFSTYDLMNWDMPNNLQVMQMPPLSIDVGDGISLPAFIDPSSQYTENLRSILTAPATWCIAISWILAAFLYALFCARGTRTFDVAGSIVSLLILLAGIILAAGANECFAAIFITGSSTIGMADISWMPTPLAWAGALIPGIIGIIFALMKVPDRVRYEEGEW